MDLPEKLKKSPLVEALFELRFDPAHQAAGELLPGILFQAFSGQYTKVEPLPVASVPPDIRNSDENLRYQAHYRMQGDGRTLSIGSRVVAYSRGLEYPGRVMRQIHRVYDELLSAQIDLSDDARRVLHQNRWDLYE